MLESFNAWAETLRFACEVQNVISMRLLRISQGGPQAAAEAQLMVAEKIEAFADAEAAIAQALSAGEGFMVAAERGYAPLRRCAGAWAPIAAAWRARWRDPRNDLGIRSFSRLSPSESSARCDAASPAYRC